MYLRIVSLRDGGSLHIFIPIPIPHWMRIAQVGNKPSILPGCLEPGLLKKSENPQRSRKLPVIEMGSGWPVRELSTMATGKLKAEADSADCGVDYRMGLQ